MQTEEREMDTFAWDGNAAMSSAKTAADYRAICAGKRDGDPALRSTWALPHHRNPGAPANADGVRAALQRVSLTQGIDRDKARAHLEAHMAEMSAPNRDRPEPPKEIVRALGNLELRESPGDGTIGTLRGYLSRFGEWAHIESIFEGEFMERVAAGSFLKSIERDRQRYRPLYEHGKDPQIARKPLGPIRSLGEDDQGAFYEVGLLDTDYNRSLLPGLKEGLYGSSFRGEVRDQDFERFPEESDANPDRMPERTIREVSLMDFGPCPFPAYVGATATARSMTDEFLMGHFTQGEGLQRLAEYAKQAKPIEVFTETENNAADVEVRNDPEPDPDPAPEPAKVIDTSTATEEQPLEEQPPATTRTTEEEEKMDTKNPHRSREELVSRQSEVASRQAEIARDHPAGGMTEETRAEWDALKTEKLQLERWKAERDEMESMIEKGVGEPEPDPGKVERGFPEFQTKKRDHDIFDAVERRKDARSIDEEKLMARDDARRAVETARFPQETKTEHAQTHAETLLFGDVNANGYVSERILRTGSPIYQRAFSKAMTHQPLTSDESVALRAPAELERALSLTTTAGGFAVPFTLDPTIIPTSSGAVNPFREISRVESITGDEWRGVSSAGITAAFAAEATETTDNSPTLAQPTVSTEKAQAFIPFSIEIGMDWDGLQSQMAILLQDAKDELEASKFVSGSGTNEPFGFITGATTTVNAGAGQTFTLANLYALEQALPPRFRARATFVANRAIYNKIRQFDTSGGAGLWIPTLAQGFPNVPNGALREGLLAYPTYESSAMASTFATGDLFLAVGDFRYFLIADRIGLNVETMQHLVGTNHRPTGQRGLYAYWRVGSKVLNAAAFRVLIGLA